MISRLLYRPLTALAAMLIASMLLPISLFAQSPAATPTGDDLYADVVPSLVQQIRAETDRQLPIVTVTGNLVPGSEAPARIEGSLSLAYINFTDAEQTELFLRLYPNFTDYGGGSMSVSNVTIDGQPVEPVIGSDTSLATLALPTPLQPGDRATVTLDFLTTIPVDPVTSYGMFGYFTDSSSYNLAQWMPLLAGWDPANGWLLERPATVGDPVFSNVAMFDITLTMPSNITMVTTGTRVDEDVLGPLTTHRWVAGPARDFVMSGGTDLQVVEQQVGETTVRSWYFSGYEEVGALVLQYGVDSFDVYSDAFGPYPYTEMDLIQTRLGAEAAGVEFPGLMYIGASHYDPSSSYLEFTVVHEVAHQWWYGVVGNNQYLHAFTDEAMANASSIIYKEQVSGPDAANTWVVNYLKRPFLTMLFGNLGDMVVDQPSADFLTNGPYGRTVYAKGALGVLAIRDAIGQDAFFQGLRDYYAMHRFGIAQPEDLRAALENASGQDLSELWAHWFERTEGLLDFTPEDLLEING
ncbi:MAG: M1 family metallopeptidase [Thermomicrobiales bacterium]|nr:M1 family metallopeptidase [Thermomicrobiales bacterium]MCO5220547.1 M1 family metallopeptidase [Thermomicrobiales bacterium]